jgi:hypothetical protein
MGALGLSLANKNNAAVHQRLRYNPNSDVAPALQSRTADCTQTATKDCALRPQSSICGSIETIPSGLETRRHIKEDDAGNRSFFVSHRQRRSFAGIQLFRAVAARGGRLGRLASKKITYVVSAKLCRRDAGAPSTRLSVALFDGLEHFLQQCRFRARAFYRLIFVDDRFGYSHHPVFLGQVRELRNFNRIRGNQFVFHRSLVGQPHRGRAIRSGGGYENLNVNRDCDLLQELFAFRR